MLNTGYIVIGCVIALFAILAGRQGEIRLHNETRLKMLETELALKKEENKRCNSGCSAPHIRVKDCVPFFGCQFHKFSHER